MVKLTPQECFDNACNTYEEAKRIIRDLSNAATEFKSDFSYEIAMKQFDLIVQCILLNLAVQDRDFCELEKVFIKNIVEYTDLLDVVNEIVKSENPEWIDITWDVINELTPENKEKLGLICANVIEKYADQFTYFFSAIDVIDERDYLDELRGCIFKLCIMLDAVDEGGFDPDAIVDAEAERGIAIYKAIFQDNWDKNTKYFEDMLNSSEE